MENRTEIEKLKNQRQQMRKNKANYDANSLTSDELQKQIDETILEVSESSNYKINKINSGIDKKSKKNYVVYVMLL